MEKLELVFLRLLPVAARHAASGQLPEAQEGRRGGARASWEAAPPAARAATGLQSSGEWEAMLQGGVTALLLVLTFGWAGSPGEWMPWAMGTI